MKKHLQLLLLLFFAPFLLKAECTDSRFKDPVFNSIQIINDIQYGANTTNKGDMQNLFLDVYMPKLEEDDLKTRPVVLLLHGGSFIGGSKNGGDIKMLGRELAKRGYVAVAVQYRLEQANNVLDNPILEFADKMQWYAAILRGAHDIKAAVRYIKHTADELGNPYGVDTNNFTLYGSSAGAIAVLHAFYLDEMDDIRATWNVTLNKYGGFEGTTNDYPYTSMNTIRNLILDSGAIDEIEWIGENNNYVDVLAMQYDLDPSVPYSYGCFYTAFCHLDRFYGTKFIVPRVESMGARVESHVFNGINHPVQDNEPQFVLEKSVNFLYTSQCKYYAENAVPTGVINRETTTLSLYPNPNNGTFQINVQNLEPSSLLQVHNVSGQLVHQQYMESAQNKIQLPELSDGVYFITLQQPSGQNSVSKMILRK